MTLTQKIVVSSVFAVTEILSIENHQLDITFSMSPLGQIPIKPTNDQTSSDTN
jgi:hypothetical protein